eukprot:527997-Pyramimonas_sp.AAC.1
MGEFARDVQTPAAFDVSSSPIDLLSPSPLPLKRRLNARVAGLSPTTETGVRQAGLCNQAQCSRVEPPEPRTASTVEAADHRLQPHSERPGSSIMGTSTEATAQLTPPAYADMPPDELTRLLVSYGMKAGSKQYMVSGETLRRRFGKSPRVQKSEYPCNTCNSNRLLVRNYLTGF